MVGRGDEHRVDLLPDCVKHSPVISEDLDLVRVPALALHPFLHGGGPVVVHLDQADEVFFRLTLQVRHSASAAADLDEANLVAGVRGVEDVERSGGESTRGEG